MRTPRVFISESISPGGRIILPEAEGRHLARVLRRRRGDDVQLLTEGGRAFGGRVREIGRDGRVVVEVIEELSGDALPAESGSAPGITIGLAVVKGPAFELALRMAVELGVESVVPLFTARTVVRWERPAEKLRRFERIAREAAKQCGRARPLRLGEAAEVSSWIESTGGADAPAAARWIAVPGAGLPGRSEAFVRGPSATWFAVGPEGGFTDAEVEAAVAAGWKTCGFPTPVLRTPTAVALIAALGLLWDGA